MHGGISDLGTRPAPLSVSVVVHRQTYGDPCTSATAWRSSPTDKDNHDCDDGSARGVAEDLGTFRREPRMGGANLNPSTAPTYLGHAADDADHVVRAKAILQRIFDAGPPDSAIRSSTAGGGYRRNTRRAIDVTYGYELPWRSTPHLHHHLADHPDFGTEEQKKRFIPAALKGDELWVQFLSEPTGGSDWREP
jgi:hypothetical protein